MLYIQILFYSIYVNHLDKRVEQDTDKDHCQLLHGWIFLKFSIFALGSLDDPFTRLFIMGIITGLMGEKIFNRYDRSQKI